MIDGSDNNDISVTIATSQLVPEAVAEFQVQTNAYSVEFGRNSGAQVNVITKSGTNTFRGEVWDYFRTNSLASLTNLEKDQDLEEPSELTRHQVGASLGGPIIKDRTFFFLLYQYDPIRPESSPSATTVRIPTQSGFAALAGRPAPGGPAGLEPPGRPRPAVVPERRLRAEPVVPEPQHAARERGPDRDRPDEREHHAARAPTTTSWAASTTG